MTPQAQLAMIALIPIVFYLFTRYPPYKAVVISFILAWLFLPQKASFTFPGLPDYNRTSATSYAILLGVFLYDVGRFRSFKFGWLDIPMLIWCLICPFASSISSGLGVYAGLSDILSTTLLWGVPYFLGRIYLNNLARLHFLAFSIFIGGLVYLPLCLYEIRMSPQLHRMVYGYFPHASFGQTARYGGFRPQVFMQHGLQVGFWIMAASLVGIWLWQAGVIKQLLGISMSWLVSVLFITFVLVKSTGAWLLMAMGMAILFAAKWLRSSFPFFLIIMMIFSYLYGGVTGEFTGEKKDAVLEFMAELTTEERADSLGARFHQDEVLGNMARQKIVFGWGGWGWDVYEETGQELRGSGFGDSLWIQAFSQYGVVGLLSLYIAMLLPVLSFCLLSYPAKTWFHPKVAPASALAVVIILYMFDNLLNSMENPVYMLICGAISGLVINQRKPYPKKVTGNRAAVDRQSLAHNR